MLSYGFYNLLFRKIRKIVTNVGNKFSKFIF